MQLVTKFVSIVFSFRRQIRQTAGIKQAVERDRNTSARMQTHMDALGSPGRFVLFAVFYSPWPVSHTRKFIVLFISLKLLPFYLNLECPGLMLANSNAKTLEIRKGKMPKKVKDFSETMLIFNNNNFISLIKCEKHVSRMSIRLGNLLTWAILYYRKYLNRNLNNVRKA